MYHPQVAAFARLADGKAVPNRKIEGQSTLLTRTMHAIEYDEIHDEIVLPNQFAQAILTFRGSASGEEPPIRVIQGSNTQLQENDRLAVDPVHNEIFVPEQDRVLVFPRDANGNVAPIRVIYGPDTQLGATKVAVDPVNDLLIVAGSYGGRGAHLLIFNRTADGNTKPLRVIRGPKTMLTNPKGPRVYSPGGWILVAEDGEEEPDVSFVGVWSIQDEGDVPPRWTIGGPHGTLVKPRGVALDPRNQAVIVSDKGLNAVLTYHVPELFRGAGLGASPAAAADRAALGRGLARGRLNAFLRHLRSWLPDSLTLYF